nr:CAP-Gly domain-containing linker protein 1 isoform X3 [Megalopta genalis]
MGEPKPSGLRPPSKIGRPCSNLPPRPAVPPSPPRPAMNQMEHLWETHGRRLSEAGLRRGSDTSVVLTEDTDSFIIGDRVWVGGTKPGAIAYIGETQFAPGDWAGVVLDEPIGKNDGSVAGCRYFQCEAKRGIFSRLTRLTREAISDSMMSPTQRTPTTPPDSMKGSLGRTICPSLNASTTSLSSTVSQRDFRIGDRVIVSSSQGSKTGVLRYMGTTEFAAGEWCGVELDDPVGKNDGSVGDNRYFECRPKYGLFAPAHKVSRSPTSKRTSCMVHRPTGAALNSSVKKTGSRESLISLSSIASTASTAARAGINTPRRPGMRTSAPALTALQESLKEKQQEIEMLRRERDLERERVTKAANQADQAEQSILSLKLEYEQYREKMQRTVTEAEADLIKLLEEKNTLTLQLEEEKRKCEDLLFRFEEESVNKDDIQVINTVNENKIKDLEKQLAEERERVAQFEQDSIKLFETEEELARLRNEVSNAAQNRNLLEDVQNQNKCLEETKTSLEKEVQEKTTLVEQCVAQIRELEAKLNESQKENAAQKESDASLKAELETQINLNKTKDEELIIALKKLEELSEKLKLMEEKNVLLSEQIQEYQSQAEDSFKIVQEKQKLEQDIASLMATEVNSSVQLKKLHEELLVKEKELSELRSTSAAEIEELTKRYQIQIEEQSKCISDANVDISQKSMLLSKLEQDIAELRSILANKDEEIKNLKEKTSELQDALALSEQTKTNLESELRVFEKNIEKLTEQVAGAENKITQVTAQKEKLEADIENLISSSANSSEQLMKYNEDLRAKERELDELRDKSFKSENAVKSLEGKLSNMEQELNKNSALIQEQLAELEASKSQLQKEEGTKSELLDKIKQFEAENGELKKTINESEQVRGNLNEKLQKALNSAAELLNAKEEILNVQKQYDALKNLHDEDTVSLQQQIGNLQTELVASQEETKALQKLKSKLEADQSANRWSIEELTEKLSAEAESRKKLESSISEKDSELQHIQSKLSELEKANEALIVNKETTDRSLTSTVDTLSTEIKELKEKLGNALEAIKIKDDSLAELKKSAEEADAQIFKLNDTITSMKEEQSNSEEKVKKMQEAVSTKEDEVKDITQTKISLEANINTLKSELKTVKEELNLRIRSLQEVEGTIKELQNAKDESVIKLQNALQSEVKSKQTEIENMLRKNSELEHKQVSLQSLIDKQANDLNDKEVSLNKLTAQINALESVQKQMLDDINKENGNLLDSKESLEKLLKDGEQKIEILTNTMKNKEKEADKNLQNLMEKMNRMSAESTQLKEEQNNLERENKQITAKYAEAMNQLKLSRENMKNNYDVGGGDMKQHIVDQDIDILKLKEENETAQTQINFLNSVIVDMQRKNDILKCKVEVLEMGVPANEADDYTQNTLEKRMATPRMFCDICDQFDLHETEDCPRQAQDFLETEKVAKSPKKVSAERPYCENCEMFGHDTRDCDDAETF